MNINKYSDIAREAMKMTDEQLLKTFESLKEDGKFYTTILNEVERLKKPDSHRYLNAKKNLDALNDVGPKIAALIKDKGLTV